MGETEVSQLSANAGPPPNPLPESARQLLATRSIPQSIDPSVSTHPPSPSIQPTHPSINDPRRSSPHTPTTPKASHTLYQSIDALTYLHPREVRQNLPEPLRVVLLRKLHLAHVEGADLGWREERGLVSQGDMCFVWMAGGMEGLGWTG